MQGTDAVGNEQSGGCQRFVAVFSVVFVRTVELETVSLMKEAGEAMPVVVIFVGKVEQTALERPKKALLRKRTCAACGQGVDMFQVPHAVEVAVAGAFQRTRGYR